jgi:hypothetical protein
MVGMVPGAVITVVVVEAPVDRVEMESWVVTVAIQIPLEVAEVVVPEVPVHLVEEILVVHQVLMEEMDLVALVRAPEVLPAVLVIMVRLRWVVAVAVVVKEPMEEMVARMICGQEQGQVEVVEVVVTIQVLM